MSIAERVEITVAKGTNRKPTLEMVADRHTHRADDEAPIVGQMLDELAPPKAVIMKLLYIDTFQLTPAEIRHLAEVSRRSIPDLVQQLDELRVSVRERKATVKAQEDALDAVQAWIALYERHIQQIAADIAVRPAKPAAAMAEERRELEEKIHRREHQRGRLLERIRRRKVTAPYKEIAAILNTTTGNIGSQIARVRQELWAKSRAMPKEHDPPAIAPAAPTHHATQPVIPPRRQAAAG